MTISLQLLNINVTVFCERGMTIFRIRNDKAANAVVFPPQTNRRGERLRPCIPTLS